MKVNVLITALMMIITTEAHGRDNLKSHKQLHSFVIGHQAQKQDWQYFMQRSFESKIKIWNYHTRLGRSLRDWHWQWRIGWVRSCGTPQHIHSSLCVRIIREATDDKAMVVRAAVARLYGTIYSGQQHAQAISTLKNMYDHPRNTRKGRPLFIAQEILTALVKIGGETAHQAAQNLASRDRSTERFYHQYLAPSSAP